MPCLFAYMHTVRDRFIRRTLYLHICSNSAPVQAWRVQTGPYRVRKIGTYLLGQVFRPPATILRNLEIITQLLPNIPHVCFGV